MKFPQHILLDLTRITRYSEQDSGLYSIGRRLQCVHYKPQLTLSTHVRKYVSPVPYKKLSKWTLKNTNLVLHSPVRGSWDGTKSSGQTAYRDYSPLLDAHFLIKEQLYTKLKYSRCPQYDIVSGGFAALLAGFIGFLISEKFGIELVDSGDFYNAFMYVVFITCSTRPLLLIVMGAEGVVDISSPVSMRPFAVFFGDLSVLAVKCVRRQLSFRKLF